MSQFVRFDWALKHILREKANFCVLEGFLFELTGLDFKILEISESESNQDTKEDLITQVDMLVATQAGDHITVGLQTTPQKFPFSQPFAEPPEMREKQINYLNRIFFGTSSVITKTKRAISITIAYFNIGQGDDYIYHGNADLKGIHAPQSLKFTAREQMLYQNQYYIIRLNSFDQAIQNTLDEWVYFLKNEKLPKNCTAKGLKEVSEKLDVLKLSAKNRLTYDRYTETIAQATDLTHKESEVLSP